MHESYENAHRRILIRKPEGKRPLGRLDVDGRIILKLLKEMEYEHLEYINR
jgi:hypothetical protein